MLINWQEIDTVMLDMDGTLLDLYFDNHFWLEHLPRRFAEHHNKDWQTVQDDLKNRYDAMRGTLDWYCLDFWSDYLNLSIIELKREIDHLISIRPHAESFLQRLHQGPWQCWLVTNAHPASVDLKFDKTGINRYFDQIISSHEFRSPKEDDNFWQSLQASHPFDPAKTLLIDDNEQVLASAERYGLAKLITLLQPDSQQQIRQQTHFPSIHHFDEIMPPSVNTN